VRVLGEEPGPGLPNQHAKACPRFQTMHCRCPPATGPNQPHLSDCVHYKRPIPPTGWNHPALKATVASWHDWEPEDSTETEWAQNEPVLPPLPPPSVDFIKQAQAYNHALAWASMQKPESYVHVPPLDPKIIAAGDGMTANLVKTLNGLIAVKCNCDRRFGAISHAGDCPAKSVECNCAAFAAFEDVDIDHAASCPMAKSVCQVPFGADDICALPADSPIHALGSKLGHAFMLHATPVDYNEVADPGPYDSYDVQDVADVASPLSPLAGPPPHYGKI
jgi:hypothetical protein